MKFLINSLLIGVLALLPLGCDPDDEETAESVSANNSPAEPPARAPSRSAPPAITDRGPDQASPPRKTVRPAAPATTAPRETRRVDRTRQGTGPSPVTAPLSASVPAGTELTVTLLDAVGSDISREGDSFTATLSDPIVVHGRVVAEKGSRVTGRVQNIEEAGRVKGVAKLELVLGQITAGNRNYRISTRPFIAVAEDTKERDAAIIAGGAGAGAIIGAVTGGKKGAAIGAVLGGGSGTTAVLVTKGKSLRLDPETRVNFVLSDDVTLPVLRRAIS